MPNLKELREARVEKMNAANALNGKSTLTADEQRQFDAILAEVEDLDTQIDRAIKADELARRSFTAPPVQGSTSTTAAAPITVNYLENRTKDTEEGVRKNYSFIEAIRMASDPKAPFSGLVAEMHQHGQKEARDLGQTTSGLAVPGFVAFGYQKRDLIAGTTTAGGHTVQTTVGELIPFLQPNLVLEAAGATMMRGLSGNVDLPRNDANGAAAWAAEQGTAAETSPTFDKVTLSPKRLTAFAEVSKQLMLQSTIDVENWVRMMLSRYVANALDTAGLAGTGSSNQPSGLSTLSGVNSVAIGTNGGAPTFAKMIEMESAVSAANADFGSLAYVTHPTLAGRLKQVDTASNAGRFLWTVSANPVVGDPGKVAFQQFMNGYRAFATTLTPTGLTKGTSSDCIAVYYGNWNEMLVGQWGGLDIVADPYTRAKDATVVLTINSFWDIQVKHAASFARCLDARNV